MVTSNHVLAAAAVAVMPMLAPAAAPAVPENPTTVDSIVVEAFDPRIPGVPQTGRHADAVRQNLKFVKLPPGFRIDVYAIVPDAHHLAASPVDYGVFVGTRKSTVWVVPDPDGEARPQDVKAFAPSLKFRMPDGLCSTADGFLVVVEQNRIRTFSTMELFDGGHVTRVVEAVPQGKLVPATEESRNDARTCRVGADKQLYVALGQPGDVPARDKLGFYDEVGIGGIIRLQPFLGTGREVYARGIRNVGGLEFNPKDRSLWFTDDRMDGAGSDSAAGEINRSTVIGQSFGFPWIQGRTRMAVNGYDQDPLPSNLTEPQVYTEPRAGAQGLLFYTALRFPLRFRGGLFSVQHGSRSGTPVDAKIMFTSLKPDGTADKTEVFAEGWLDRKTNRHRGRPVDLAQLFDGSMLVSDDVAGAVYRITYDGL